MAGVGLAALSCGLTETDVSVLRGCDHSWGVIRALCYPRILLEAPSQEQHLAPGQFTYRFVQHSPAIPIGSSGGYSDGGRSFELLVSMMYYEIQWKMHLGFS